MTHTSTALLPDATRPAPTKWKRKLAWRVVVVTAILAFNLLVLILWASAWIIMATVNQNQVSGG